MTINRPDSHLDGPARTSSARFRWRLIAVASIATGIVAGVAAASGTGPFQFMHPTVVSHPALSAKASSSISAESMFPPPTAPLVSTGYVAYHVPPTAPKPAGPPTTSDDQPKAPPPAGGGDQGGGDN